VCALAFCGPVEWARLFWARRVGFNRAPAMREMCLLTFDRLPIVPTESFFPILPVFAKNRSATSVRFVKPGRHCRLAISVTAHPGCRGKSCQRRQSSEINASRQTVVERFAIPESRTATLGRLLSGRSARHTANWSTTRQTGRFIC